MERPYSQNREIIPVAKNLLAPELGRTATTIMLLWDAENEKIPDMEFDILLNGQIVASTKKQCFTMKGLSPGTQYWFEVRARQKEGNTSCDGPSIEAATKPLGEVFNVKANGAAGDGVKEDTASIQAAIDCCSKGGTVFIPAGTYYMDTIVLKSDMTFYLDENATILMVEREKVGCYPPEKFKTPTMDGYFDSQACGAIVGVGLSNVTIMGKGIINGNGSTWWEAPTGYRGRRPCVISMNLCRNVLIQGITILDSPFFNIVLSHCDDVICSDLKILKVAEEQSNNGDGMDPSACRNLLIAGCTFANQDDSIAIKNGMMIDNYNFRMFRPIEYVTIRDCTFDAGLGTGGANAVVIGSGVAGGVRHITIRNCVVRNMKYVLHIKSLRGRGGIVEDVMVSNIDYYSERNHHYTQEPSYPIYLNAQYWFPHDPEPQPVNQLTPVFRNITFKDIRIVSIQHGAICILGLPEMPVQDVAFINIQASTKYGVEITDAREIRFENVTINPEFGPRYELKNVQSICIE